MKYIYSLLLSITLTSCSYPAGQTIAPNPSSSSSIISQPTPTSMAEEIIQQTESTEESDNDKSKPTIYFLFSEPIDNALSRITKKPFGIYITPENSPVQPEKFSGYHTGTDFEVTADEIDKEIPVYAICEGFVMDIKKVNGYGGVIIQSCPNALPGSLVLYGHISQSKTLIKKGGYVDKGTQLTILGAHESEETAGERKHLHLGIYSGDIFSYRGYVDSESELSNWLDFEDYYTVE